LSNGSASAYCNRGIGHNDFGFAGAWRGGQTMKGFWSSNRAFDILYVGFVLLLVVVTILLVTAGAK
jgi:hypothetical protein